MPLIVSWRRGHSIGWWEHPAQFKPTIRPDGWVNASPRARLWSGLNLGRMADHAGRGTNFSRLRASLLRKRGKFGVEYWSLPEGFRANLPDKIRKIADARVDVNMFGAIQRKSKDLHLDVKHLTGKLFARGVVTRSPVRFNLWQSSRWRQLHGNVMITSIARQIAGRISQQISIP
jgi:hypothetical protein